MGVRAPFGVRLFMFLLVGPLCAGIVVLRAGRFRKDWREDRSHAYADAGSALLHGGIIMMLLLGLFYAEIPLWVAQAVGLAMLGVVAAGFAALLSARRKRHSSSAE